MAETKQENNRKKELAKMLFLHENLSQKEIAARVGKSEVTISKWVRTEKWESLKVSVTITKEEQLKNLYRQLAEINNSIAGKEEGLRFADSKEADTISKLAGAIEKMEGETGVAEIISVSRKFLVWLRKFDLPKTQEIAPLFDAYIKDSIR